MKDLLTGVNNINGYTKKKTHPWKRHTIKTDLSERLNQSKKAQNKIDLQKKNRPSQESVEYKQTHQKQILTPQGKHVIQN